MKMANEKKSIIEEALLEAEKIDATFKSNAKEILAQTMSSEIEEMVKESLKGSKKRLKEENEEEEIDLDLDSEEGEENEEMDLDTEEGEEDMDLDLDLDSEEGEEDEEMNIDLDTEEGEEDLDLDLDSEEGEEDVDMDLDLDLGDDTEGEETETVDLTGASNSDVISVFKKMGPEDEIEVINDNGVVTLKDNRSGSEYKIELNSGTASVEDIELGLEEGEEDSEGVIYEIVVNDEEDEMSDYMDVEEDYMGYEEESEEESEEDYMNSYMSKKGLHYTEKYNDNHKLKGLQKTKLPDELQKGIVGSEDEEDEDYMARTISTKGRYVTGNRTNPYAKQRMGSSEYMGESKTPQITKLIKENTDLNTNILSIQKENSELKENHEKMVDALKQFRKKLQEVAVFNSNLTYAVRLFTEQSTTKEEKQDILKRLDSAKDLKESQSIYKQLVKEYTNGKAPIKESIEEKFNKTASSGAQISESSVFVHPELQNMKKLWEYSYKK
jgi:hypothetical protein